MLAATHLATLQTQNDIQEINLSIKRGFLDSRKRQLILNPAFIQFEDKDLLSDPFTRFVKSEIIAFRYGINWIQGYRFTIGREYQIFIHNQDNKTLKINFKSFYGIKKAELHKLYGEIIKALWDFYFGDITDKFLNKFRNGNDIDVGNVPISQRGVTIKASGIFKEQAKFIPWEKVRTRDYQTYFNIHSTEDTVNINRSYSYLKDWNTAVLYSVVRTILCDKQLIES